MAREGGGEKEGEPDKNIGAGSCCRVEAQR